MEEKEKIRIAKWAIMKGISDHETLKYSDELYGKEGESEDVWDYVDECHAIGEIAFRQKYPD